MNGGGDRRNGGKLRNGKGEINSSISVRKSGREIVLKIHLSEKCNRSDRFGGKQQRPPTSFHCRRSKPFHT